MATENILHHYGFLFHADLTLLVTHVQSAAKVTVNC